MEEMSKTKTSHFSHSFYYTQLFLFTSVGATDCLMQTPDTKAWKHVPHLNKKKKQHKNRAHLGNSIFLIAINYLHEIYHKKPKGEIPTYTSVLWLSQCSASECHWACCLGWLIGTGWASIGPARSRSAVCCTSSKTKFLSQEFLQLN